MHKRYFGLFRWNGSVKEATKVIPTLDRRRGKRETRSDWIDMKPDEYYRRPREHLERLYRRFKDRFPEGMRTESQAFPGAKGRSPMPWQDGSTITPKV